MSEFERWYNYQLERTNEMMLSIMTAKENGESLDSENVRQQILGIVDHENRFLSEMNMLATLSEENANRWCACDLLKYGVK